MNKNFTSQNHKFNLKTIVFLLALFLCKTTSLQASSSTDCSAIYADSEVQNSELLIQSISEANDLETFHLFSHGRSGELLINGEWKNAKAIVSFLNAEFNSQNSTFKNVNIYGCEFAKGEKGLKAVSYLEKALGLQVNASTNITGIDGDWLLEIGQIAANINKYQYNLQTAAVPNSGANEDYDGDGVINSEDLDDDNDGILDEIECPNSGRRFEWQASDFTNAGITSANGQTVDFGLSTGIDLFIGIDLNVKFESTNYPNGNTSELVNGAENQIVWANTPGETQTLTLTFSDPLPYTTLQMIFDPQVTDGELNTFQADAPGSFEHPLSAIGDGVLGSNFVRNPVGGSINHAYQNQAPGGFLRYNIEEGATTLVMTTSQAASGANTSSNNGFLLVFNTPAPCDTDGDGLLDYLDLDSDGDGCPDATEGGDNYTTLVPSSISGGNSGNDYVGNSTVGVQDNLGNNVNTSGNNIGVPIITGSGQTNGSSKVGGAVFTDFTSPANISICSNAEPNEATFTSTINTTNPSNASINYQWQLSTDGGGSFSDIAGESGTTTSGTANDLLVSGIDTSFNGNVYKIIYASDDNSCPEEAEALLTVYAPPVVTIDAVDPICVNADAIQLTGTPATGGAFSGDGVSGNMFNPATATAGTHVITYSYTDANGCTSEATTDIEVLPEETVTLTATTSPTTTCDGTNFTANFSTTPSTATVVWTGDNGTPSDTSDDVTGTGNIPDQSLYNTTTNNVTYTYVAVATSPNGCSTATETISVTVKPKPEVTTSVCEIEICSEETANISFTSTVSGTTYSWTSNNGTPSDTSDDATGTGDISEVLTNSTTADVTHVYTITGTSDGCDSEPRECQVIVKPLPNAGADQTIGCFSQDTATMAATGSGTWSLDTANSDGTATIADASSPTTTVTGFSATGTYTLIWTAANGCTDTAIINAGNACECTNPPTVTLSSATGATCGTTPITITGNTFGGYATMVTLSEDGLGSLTATSANTTPFEFTYTPVASDAGNTVTITVTTDNPNTENGLCEAATATYTLDINQNPTVNAGNDFTITCVTNTSGLQIGENPETGYEYSWSPVAGLSDPAASNPTANPTTTTTYTVTKTETATDCFSTDTVTVTVNNTPPTVAVEATDEQSNNANDGTLTATVTGGQPTFMFSWDRTEPAADAATGVYNTQSVENVSPGTYQVTVTDANGCFVTSQTKIVNEYNCNTAILFGDATLAEVNCFGGSDGEALIPFSANNGPFHIVLTKGTVVIQDDLNVATNADINYTGLSTGSYTVTITDSKGCTSSDTFTIDQPSQALIANATTVQNQLTFGGTEGSVTADPTGGTPNYTYSWTSPDYPSFSSTDQTPTGLLPGTYNVVVTDANNCTTEGTTIVQELGCDVSFTINAPEILCFEDQVTVSVTASGGTGTYSYSWINNSDNSNADSDTSTPSEAVLEAGSYTIMVTDANNCPTSQTLDLTQPADLSLAIDVNPVACHGESTATIDLTVSGGTGSYEYSWTKDGVAIADQTQDLSNVPAGDYIVTVTDANNCIKTLPAEVLEPAAAVEVTLNNVTAITCNNNGVITINQPTGGTGASTDYTYSWVNEAGTAVTDAGSDTDPLTFEVTTAGTYTLTVEDINSCSATLDVDVLENKDIPVLTLGEYSCDSDTSTYGIGYFTNGGTPVVTNALGVDITNSVTLGTNEITGIPFGTDVTITIGDSTSGCSTSIGASALTKCPSNCVFPDLTVGQPICDGGTTNTYTVSYQETSGAIITVMTPSGAVTEDGDGIIQAALGTEITVTATNGECEVSYTIASPENCDDPCTNPPISIGGTECSSTGDNTYNVTYSVVNGATVASDSGDFSVSGIVTGITSGTPVILTVTYADCSETTTVTVPAAECPECQLPTLTLGNVSCDASGYSIEVISNSTDIDSTGGTPSATMITGIAFGETVTITAGTGSCTTSIDYTAGATCPTDCVLPDLTLGQPVCNGQGSATYTVSYTENTGAVISTTGNDNNDGTITANIGQNITVTATNGDCVVTYNITSPASCDDPCDNPLISIGGTECSSTGDATYSVYYTAIDGATVTSSHGDSSVSGIVTGISSANDVILTVTYSGCPDVTTVTVPAAECPECQLPTLTLGTVSCDASGYSIEVISNSTDIDSTGGTPSATMITGIAFGETVTITAGIGSCTTSIDYTAGATCPTDCVLPDLTLGQPVCNGQGSTTYSVSYTENTDAIITVTTNGTTVPEDGDGVITADIGDNIIVTATNGDCIVTYSITSPTNCDDPCDNPLISIGGTDCAIDGSAFYSVYYTAINGATVSSSTGDSTVPGVISGISSGTDVILTVTYPGCPETTTVTVPSATCPECVLPTLTVGTTECEGTTYAVSFNSNGVVTASAGTVGTDSVTNIPLGTDIIITSSNGDCTVSMTVTGLSDPCDPDCDLPGLVAGQPICGAEGEYAVSYTVEDSSAVVAITGGTDASGTITAALADTIVISVTNDCGTESVTINSSALNCTDNPCGNPAISISGTDCAIDGSAFYTVSFTASSDTTVTSTLGTVDLASGTITGIPSGENVTVTATLAGCTESQSTSITAPNCPECVLPTLTVGTTECEGTTYAVSFNSNGVVTANAGTVGTDSVTNIPLGTDIIITSSNGDCTVSMTVTGLSDPCDPDCDLPGLVAGQPICGAEGEYAVSYTVEDSSAVVAITGGTDASGTITAALADTIVISVTNDCGTESVTINSSALDCTDNPCGNPAISISGTDCAIDGSAFYTVSFTASSDTTVTSTLGTVDLASGTITGIPSGENVTVTATLAGCTESQSTEITAPECPECVLPTLTVGTTECEGTTYAVSFNSNGVVTASAGTVGADSVTNIPLGTDIIITSSNGDCTVSMTVTGLSDPCDPDCDLPGLVAGQPICGAEGEYAVSYTVEDSSAVVAITGGTDASGTITAALADTIVISVTNDCGTESVTINSSALDCTDNPCGNPAISISGTDCAIDGSAFYTVSFTASSDTTVTSTLGTVDLASGTITGIPSGENVTVTATLAGCTESQSTSITAPECPECTLPILTVGTTECEGTTYVVSFNSNGVVTASAGTVGTDSVTNIPLGTDVIITSSNGDCTVSMTVTGLSDPCDPDCDLPGLVAGQPICGAEGEYAVSYTVEDSSAVVAITGGTDASGTITAALADTIVISVTNDCGTESVTINSSALDCTDNPCGNPAISISGTDCAIDGSAFYTVSFTASSDTTVTSTLGTVDLASGTITDIPSGENVTVTATLAGCTESQSIEITAPNCPECVLPVLTVGTTECEGTTYAVSFNSNGVVTASAGTVGADSVTNIPLGTDVIITSSNGDCTVSITVTGLSDPCDPDCDLPGLVAGQPICGAEGEYAVSYTVEDSSAVVAITGGTDASGTITAALADTIVISVTNDCGTESVTINSSALDCTDNPCGNPAISISGTDCAIDGSAFYTVSFTASSDTTVTSTLGTVDLASGTITGIPSGENVTVTATLAGCTESQSTEITAPNCPECVLPVLTVGTTECEGTTYAVSFNSNGVVTASAGTVGTDSVTNIPLGTDVIITSSNGDCTVSITVTGLSDPCDPDCDLPGLVAGQPICGAEGEYAVSYTVEDSSAVVAITGGTDTSGTITAALADTIVISVTNDCGTESVTINSSALDCTDNPCGNPAISISGTDCAIDGSAFYTVSFTASSDTTVTSTLGTVDLASGTITDIPSGENVTVTATLAGCTESQSIEITAPNCPECVLPVLTVGTTECEGTTYAVSFNSNGVVTASAGTVGTDSVTNIPLGTDVIITSSNGDCTVSMTVTGLSDPCDPDCDLPGLVAGQPICGAEGEYAVSYTVEDSSAVVAITGGTDTSGTITAALADTIVISVTNDCGTESVTINSSALDCTDNPCGNPAISISGTDCAIDGSAFYTVSFTASSDTTVTSTLGTVDLASGTITDIPSGENVTVTATLAGCTESQSIEITAPNCPECVLPVLTVGTTECEGTTYAVSFNSNGVVTASAGTVGADSVTNIPLGTDVIITSSNGDCTVSMTVTGLADPCDPDCDLPGLVAGQPICGAEGEYAVSYTVEDSSAVVAITGGTDASGTITAALADTIVISVTNDCGTESVTINSSALDCTDNPCGNPAISISGTDCAIDGSAFYTVSFTASSDTTVTSTLGTVDLASGTITGIPSGENVTVTATLAGCTESQSTEITAPNCPECVLPVLTVGTTECEGTTYAVSFNSNGVVTASAGTVGTDSVTNIPLGTDVIITSSNGDCTVSMTVTGLSDPCDPDCDLPGLVAGQPICGAEGEYAVSYTVEDSSAVVAITGGTDASGTITAALADTIVISVTNDCGTESVTINSSALDCTDNPCGNPAISISGTDCAIDGSAFYTVSFTASSDTTVTSTLGTVDLASGTITGIPSGENVTVTATLASCTESQSTEITAPNCPECTLPVLTVGTTECEDKTYAVSFNSNGVVTASAGTVGTDSVTNIPLGTDVIITSSNGDCTVSITVTGLADPCDPDCDLPGLVAGQPICGAEGEYAVSYTVEDSSAVVAITGGTDASGTITAALADTIVISVTNDCGTESVTINSSALDCTDNPCGNPAISISGTDCAIDGSAFYTVSFTASSDTTVTSTLGTVDLASGTITGIPSGENVTVTATLAGCTESQSTEITAPNCPECTLPVLTVGTTECEDKTYAVSFNSNGVVTASAGTVGTDSVTNIPLGTDVIITSSNGDCTVSITVTGLSDPCDPDCDLPGLVAGQPICGAEGEYAVSYTVEDSSAVVAITGGTDASGTITAALADTIVISVTNDCGTESVTINSSALDCTDNPCGNPAISISGTDCAIDGSAFYTVSFTASSDTTVTSTLGTVDLASGTITDIPSGENVTVTATLAGCTESQSIEITAPNCPECVLPVLTVGTTECAGTTYAVSFNSNGVVTASAGTVGTDSVTNIPLGTDVIITSSNGDCTVSMTVTGLSDPCDPDCDLPGLVAGQPICGAEGEYAVSYTVEDSSAVVAITGGTDASGTITAALADTIVISVTNDCGTESVTINSSALDCTDNPCGNPAISISGTDCAIDGSAFYTVSFTASSDTTVTSTLGTVDLTSGTITGIPSGENVTVTATLAGCTESQSTSITAPECPECTLPILTVGTTECEGTTYAVSFNSNGVITASTGTVGTDSVTNIPLGTDVIITSSNGDCTVSITVTGLSDPCDPDCDLPGLVAGQPICGAEGEYAVSYTVEDSSAVVAITGGTDTSGTITAALADTIVISVTNDCGTESVTINSSALDCTDSPCGNPAISISGTDCAIDGSAFYTVSFTASSDTTVTSTLGTVDLASGTITGIPSGENVTVTATLAGCTESQSTEITAPNCPECTLPVLTVGTTECEGSTYSINYTSNGTVTATSGGAPIAGVTVGTNLIVGIPLGTDVTITSSNGDCSVSIHVTSLADPCDPDCDLPGLVAGQPVCGAEGEYAVSYTVEDSSAVVAITGGTDVSGTVTATLGTDIVITVTNDCGTESMTFNSSDLDCPDNPCSNPAISVSGTDCSSNANGEGTYTVHFEAAEGVSVTSIGTISQLPAGDVDINAGTVSNIPFDEAVTLTATIDGCVNSQSVDIPLPNCSSMELLKASTVDSGADGIINAGDIITYAFTVTNTGNVTLSDITITDAMLGITSVPVVSPVLSPGQVGTYTATYEITQADIDAGSITNSATADGSDPDNNPVTDISDDPMDETDVDTEGDGEPDDATVTDLSSPMIEITKDGVYVDADSDGVVEVGEIITYTFIVTNTGNVSVTGVSVEDTMLGITGLAVVPSDLAPGDSGTVTVDYAITEEDIAAGAVYNLATGTGTAPDGTDVTDESEDPTPIDPNDPLVDPNCPDCTVTDLTNPQMELEKTASVDAGTDGIINAGDIITYLFSVTNTGNVTLSDITITDAMLGITSVPVVSPVLSPGQVGTYTATYEITQADIDAGSITNSATADGSDPDNNPVTDISDDPMDETDVDTEGDGEPDDATVTDLSSPMIEITKDGVYVDADSDGVVEVGEIITYTFIVTNTGNVSVTGVTVEDTMLGITGLAVVPSDLAPGDSGTVTVDYAITEEDIAAGAVYNLATGTGTAPDGTDVTDESEDPTPIDPNDPLVDPNCPDCTVTDLTNPQMELEKTASVDAGTDGIINAGDIITYLFSVTNTGNVTLSDITITDAMLGITSVPVVSPVLSPGQVGTYTATYEITQADIDAGSITNSATADGSDPDNNPVTDISDDPMDETDVDTEGDGEPDDATVTDLSSPMIEITKDGVYVDADSDGVVEVGEIITYTFIVTNTGNVSVTGVTVEDTMLGITGLAVVPSDLAPGDSGTVTVDYAITEEDIAAGAVYNLATGTGTAPDGTDVTDESEDPTPIDPNDPLVDPNCPDCTVTDLTNPQMELVKAASVDAGTDGIINAGDIITYAFTVTNTGNVTLSDITITDAMLGITSVPVVSPVLSPGQVGTYTATYEITQADINAGSITNSATADGTDPNGNAVTDISDDLMDNTDVDTEGDGEPDDPTVTVLTSPMLSVIKSVTTVVDDIITYTFTVTNTGNVELTDVEVNDPLLGGLVGTIPSLAVGVSDTSITGTYTLTAADYVQGYVENTASATGTVTTAPDGTVLDTPFTITDTSDAGTDENGDPITDPEGTETLDGEGNTNGNSTDDPTVYNILPLADLSIVKTVVDNNINPEIGSTITFTIAITNDGPSEATGVTVSEVLASGYTLVNPVIATSGQYDSATGIWGTLIIDPGQTETLTISAIVNETGDYDNTAEIMTSDQGDPDSTPGNGDTTEDDISTISNINPIQASNPSISLIKVIDSIVDVDGNEVEVPEEGDIINYSFTVTNTGNVDLTNVTIVDALLGNDLIGGPIASLEVAGVDSTTFTGTYTITDGDMSTGYVENTATVTAEGVDNAGNPISISDVSDAGTDSNGDPITNPEGVETPNGAGNTNGDTTDDPTVLVLNDVVLEEIDLGVNKISDILSGNAGDEVIFTITITNNSSVDATGVVVGETIPGGFEYVSHTADFGIFVPENDEGDGIWSINTIFAGQTVTLVITTIATDIAEYTNTAFILDSDQLDTDTSNDTSSVTVGIVAGREDCVIYNEFSPNGDGVNDVFEIDCIFEFPNNTLEIYNRWGNIVYKQNAYKNDWDGTSNGRSTVNKSEKLPVGTYYYVLDFGDGETEKRAGWLYINR